MNLTATERSELRWTSTATSVAEADALLARLWTSTESRQQITADLADDADGTAPIAVRTGVMNLVVVAPGAERAVGAASALSSLARSPSRTLFIVPRDPEGPPTIRARLEVFCTVAPKIHAGRSGVTMFEGEPYPAVALPALDLAAIHSEESEVYLRYRVRRTT